MTKIDWDHNNGIVTMVPLTQEELECIRVCVKNAPIPYDIRFKKVPISILEKIGQPTSLKGEPLPRIEVDKPTVSMYFHVNNGPFSGKEGTKIFNSKRL